MRKRKINPTAALIWFSFFSIACLGYLFGAYIYGNAGKAFSGWFVSDGITLFESAAFDSMLSIGSIIENSNANIGIALFNSLIISIDSFAPAFVNFLILAYVYGHTLKYGKSWPFILLLLVPFYWISFLLPSKDILVALLYVLILDIYRIDKKSNFQILILMLLLLGLALVRDGFGVILTFTIAVVYVVEKYRLQKLLSLLVMLVGASCFLLIFSEIFQDAFILARSVGVAAQSTVLDVDTIEKPFSYFIRLFGNATNLAFRPIFSDISGGINVLSLAYWLSGMTLFYSLCCATLAIFRDNKNDQQLGMISLMLLILIAITPYVQPRYLFPLCLMIPIYTFVTIRSFLRAMLLISVISIAAALAYISTSNYPPLAEPSMFTVLSLMD